MCIFGHCRLAGGAFRQTLPAARCSLLAAHHTIYLLNQKETASGISLDHDGFSFNYDLSSFPRQPVDEDCRALY
jgi:hypothetical protein